MDRGNQLLAIAIGVTLLLGLSGVFRKNGRGKQ